MLVHSFLVACTRLYRSLCLSVRRSVCYHFTVITFFMIFALLLLPNRTRLFSRVSGLVIRNSWNGGKGGTKKKRKQWQKVATETLSNCASVTKQTWSTSSSTSAKKHEFYDCMRTGDWFCSSSRQDGKIRSSSDSLREGEVELGYFTLYFDCPPVRPTIILSVRPSVFLFFRQIFRRKAYSGQTC